MLHIYIYDISTVRVNHGQSVWRDDGGSLCEKCKTLHSTCQAFERETSSSFVRQPRLLEFVHIGIWLLQTEWSDCNLFPPHCSHKLQIMDVYVYGPLKTYANLACDAWVTNHPGHTMTIYHTPGIVNSSFNLVASPGNTKAGFQVSGNCLFNRDIFHDEEFMGAYVTHRSTPPATAAASNSNSEPPKDVDWLSRTINIYFKERKKDILLPQMTFDFFLKSDPERVRM